MQKKLTKKQKLFHFLGFPILSFFTFSLMYSLFDYLFNGDPLLSYDKGLEASASAIGISIGHWIGLFYPPRPHNDDVNKHKKSLKEYINQYVIEGTPFNKLMIIVYLLSIITVIVIVWLMIKGYL